MAPNSTLWAAVSMLSGFKEALSNLVLTKENESGMRASPENLKGTKRPAICSSLKALTVSINLLPGEAWILETLTVSGIPGSWAKLGRYKKNNRRRSEER